MKKLSIILSTILCAVLIIGPLGVLKDVIFPKVSTSQENRVHLNTANTTRVIASTPEEMGIEISKILYCNNDKKNKPKSIILLESNNWQDVLSIIPVARKYKGTIITTNKIISTNLRNYINKIIPVGVEELNGTQMIIIGRDIASLNNQLQNIKLKSTYIQYKTTDELQKIIYNMPGIISGEKYGFLVKDNDPLISIPPATWIANQGGVILYANEKNQLYDSSKEILKKGFIKNVYVLAEKSLDGDGILKPYKAKANRIIAFNPESFSVKFAKLNDADNLVGWGSDRKRSDEGHNYILCSKENPMLAIMASQLSLKGRCGPILWTDGNRLSPITENYLWRMKPNYWLKANEGPYNNVWIIGDNRVINYGIQSRVDYAQGINSYKMMGREGVSGIEVIAIIWSLIGLLGAIWTGLHLFSRMRFLSVFTKMMWILTVLVLGPVGLWVYIISYVNSPWMKANNKVLCMRPIWKQILVATVMGLSFGGSSIITIQYLMTIRGLPLGIFPEKSGVYLLGNPIIILMIVSYIVSFIINIYCFVPTMFIEIKDISYKHAKKEAFVPVVVSITSIFIGIALSMWWLSIVYSPTIPEEDYILWWGFMYLSVLIGGIVSYIPNWLLVKYGKKLGIV
ncbi:membrane protein [Clostridium sp. K25]|uniref:DUF4396 domain-containing protein n=1 Tax=Clostridium sp. K25 TaxID=1443109 RepID=UPI0004D54517|nr:DUF4396 domain-containing protein [Clostridium sp. K25]KEI09998.1 membrane protein [Clostridium sp. K25]